MSEEQSIDDVLEDKLADTVADSTDVAVFDSLDTIQGYVGADFGKNKDHYLSRIAEAHGMTKEEMAKTVSVDQQLQWTYELLQEGKLVPRILSGVEDLLTVYIERGVRPVVLTADIQGSADLVTAPLVKKGLLRKQDVHGIHPASKKDPNTWTEQLERYVPNANVVAIYEDTQANLDAAVKGYKCPGYLVKETPSGITCVPYTAK